MKKRLFAFCALAALLLTCWIPVQAAEDYDALAAAEGYHARVGEAETAYDGGAFTGYIKFNNDLSGNGGRDNALAKVPAGSTVTLIADVTITTELYLQGQYTVDGDGHTLTGAFRSDSSGADVTVKNLNIVLNAVDGGGFGRYIIQAEGGCHVLFEDCDFTVTGAPEYALFVVRGHVEMDGCTLTWTNANAGGNKDVFRLDNGSSEVTLTDTEITLPTDDSKLTIVGFYNPGTLVLRGDTVLTAAEGKAIVVGSALPSITMDTSVVAPVTPSDYPVTRYDVWDGSVDTSWFDESSIQDSYELDTAAKLAGLAKLISDSGTANWPYAAAEKEVTFYVTSHLNLAGLEWLPIGSSYGTRFGGNLVGRVGAAGEPAIIQGLNVVGSDANVGFVGTMDAGGEISNFTFESPRVSSEYDTAAVVCGYARSGGTFTDITVKDALVVVKDVQWVGGICAYSKYGADTYENCVFEGDIVASGESAMVGGIVGNAVIGAALTNCYVSGSISASGATDQVGGMVGAIDAGAALTMTDCQFDGYLQNANTSATANGALAGSAAAGETAVSLTRVFLSGVSMGGGANAAAGYSWLGALTGSGSVTLTTTQCSSLIRAAVAGSTASGVTLTGGDTGITVYKLSEVAGDNGKTTVGDAGWTMRTGLYPVVAIASTVAPTANANADYAWFDFAADSSDVGNFNELVGFSVLSKLYDFGGKTVNLTADIDGSSKLEGQALGAGGELNEYISAAFRGTFERNGHSISNVEFELGESGKYVITWVVGDNRTTEEYSYGETPSYKGETTRPDDEVYRYEFNGWDEDIVPVTADATYTARWKKTRLKDLAEEETDPPASDTEQPAGTEGGGDTTGDSEGGCQSVMMSGALPLLALLAVPAILCKPISDAKKRRNQ